MRHLNVMSHIAAVICISIYAAVAAADVGHIVAGCRYGIAIVFSHADISSREGRHWYMHYAIRLYAAS